MAVVANTSFYAGEDLDLAVTITVDGTASGTPVNISGWSLAFVVKLAPTDAAALVSKATGGSGVTITNGAAGQLSVDLDANDTKTLAAGNYYYEVARTDSGFNRVLTTGFLTLLDRVNRPA